MLKWRALLLVAIACACSSSADVDQEQCERLREHLIDLRLQASGAPTDDLGKPVDLKPHRVALRQAMGEGFTNACLKDLSRAQLECELAARDSGAVSSCRSAK